MFCTKCGKEIIEEEKYCPYCGNEVAYNELTTEGNPKKLSKQKKPKKNGRKLLIFGIVGVILIVICLVLFYIGDEMSDEVRINYKYKETVVDIRDYNIPKVTDKLSAKDWEGAYYNRLNNLIMLLYKNDDGTMSVNIMKNGSFTSDNLNDYLVISDATGKFDDDNNHTLVSEAGAGDYKFEMELIDPEVGAINIIVNDIDTGVWWYYAEEDTNISKLNASDYDIFTSYSEIDQIGLYYGFDDEDNYQYDYEEEYNDSSADEEYYETNDTTDSYEAKEERYGNWCDSAIQIYNYYLAKYVDTEYYNGSYIREDQKIVFLSYQNDRLTHQLIAIDTQTGEVVIDSLVSFDPDGAGESLFWFVDQATGEEIITFEYISDTDRYSVKQDIDYCGYNISGMYDAF